MTAYVASLLHLSGVRVAAAWCAARELLRAEFPEPALPLSCDLTPIANLRDIWQPRSLPFQGRLFCCGSHRAAAASPPRAVVLLGLNFQDVGTALQVQQFAQLTLRP